MIASDVIDLVREEVNDTIKDYRFSDAEMLSALTDATRELAQDRPDLLLDATGSYNTVVDVTATNQTLIFDDNQRQSLMHYTCYRIFSKDSEDDQNLVLSRNHLSLYNQRI